VILMVIAPVLWSSAGVVTRHIERAEPFEQVFWRSLFATLFVGVVLFSKKQKPQVGLAMLFSSAMWAVMFTAFVVALSLTTTANTLVVMSVAPLLTAFLSFVILKEKVPMPTWLAAGAAAVGIAWMFHSGLSGGHLTGMLIALMIPAAAAANLIVLRASAAHVDLVPAVMLGGALSCLIALPLALPFHASPKDLLLLGSLGVFQLGLPCMLLVVASRTLRPPEIALLGLLEVVLGPLWAWLGAGEQPGTATLLGGAVVLAALVYNASQASVTRTSG
jgi:drug/metabolite transporter (DMT)-like permease